MAALTMNQISTEAARQGAQLAQEILETSLSPTLTGEYLEDVARLNHQRLEAMEIASSQMSSWEVEHQGDSSIAFWTQWCQQNRGAEPALEAALALWPTLVEGYETELGVSGPLIAASTFPMMEMEWASFLPEVSSPEELADLPQEQQDHYREVEAAEIDRMRQAVMEELDGYLDLAGYAVLDRLGHYQQPPLPPMGTERLHQALSSTTGWEAIALKARPAPVVEEMIDSYLMTRWEEHESLPAEEWILQWFKDHPSEWSMLVLRDEEAKLEAHRIAQAGV